MTLTLRELLSGIDSIPSAYCQSRLGVTVAIAKRLAPDNEQAAQLAAKSLAVMANHARNICNAIHSQIVPLFALHGNKPLSLQNRLTIETIVANVMHAALNLMEERCTPEIAARSMRETAAETRGKAPAFADTLSQMTPEQMAQAARDRTLQTISFIRARMTALLAHIEDETGAIDGEEDEVCEGEGDDYFVVADGSKRTLH